MKYQEAISLFIDVATLTFYSLSIGLFAAIIGVVWSYLLTQPMELFEFWPNRVEKVFPYRRFEKVHKIMYQCEKCVTGQIALWYTVGTEYHHFLNGSPYGILRAVAQIASAILFAYIIVLLIKRIE